MNESTGKRQSEINKDIYKTNVTKPKDEKMKPQARYYETTTTTTTNNSNNNTNSCAYTRWHDDPAEFRQLSDRLTRLANFWCTLGSQFGVLSGNENKMHWKTTLADVGSWQWFLHNSDCQGIVILFYPLSWLLQALRIFHLRRKSRL